MAEISMSLLVKVEAGKGLAEAIAESPGVFPPLVRAAALAGAAAGSVARLALTARIDSETTIGAAAVLTGTLLAAGVVYLSIVRRPPRPISNG